MHVSKQFRSLAALSVIGLSYSFAQGQTIGTYMSKGDSCDKSFKAAEALKSYLPAEKLDPNNVELLLKISRQYRHLMSDAKGDSEKVRLGKTALAYDLKAAALAPKNADAQLSQAITYGKMLPFEGSEEQVAASPKIKSAVDRALKLNPRNDTAWHVLGRWHQTLANVGSVKRALGGIMYGSLPVGTNEQSIACFEKAIAINPKRPRHYIELGRTYAQRENNETARRFIEKGLAMADVEKDDYEIKARGRETLKSLP